MKDPFDQRLVFFGGKGGVGKTTCAAAFALLASQKKRRTLLVSTDPAHSLSDIFQISIGTRETDLQPGLYGMEINPDHEAEAYIGNVKAHLRQWIDPDSMRTFTQQMDLIAVSPGIQEAALFDKITDLITRCDEAYDLLVFDTAPTGQTLRLLTLPELMGSWIQALAKRRRKVSSLWKMFSRTAQKPIEEDPILALLEKRQQKFEKAREILMDPSRTGFYMVLMAEKLPILETQKAIPILKRYRIPIRGMVVNRLLPENAEGTYLQKRKDQEHLYLQEIEALFRSFRPVPLYQKETDVMDLEGLNALARELSAILPQTGPSD